MSNENNEIHLNDWEERLYETVEIVPPCPYCGCDRMVIAHHSSWYETPVEYRVEHVDEKEAVTNDCFDMFYAFKSVEDAIEKASQYRKRFDDELETEKKIWEEKVNGGKKA